MSDVLFLYNDIEKYPNEIQLCDCFFGCGLQLIKGKKNVDELFSAVEYMIITKLITTERIVVFGSDIFVLCSVNVYFIGLMTRLITNLLIMLMKLTIVKELFN